MPKVMLINVTHSEESRVAILNGGVLESFEIESLSREHLKGNIYKGTIHRIHPALEAAFVDIGADRDAFLPLDEICFRNLPTPPPPPVEENGKRRRRIRDLFKPGDEILVQIAKEQFANKPPTLTTFYSLPGRYLVLLPGSDDTTGISRRIEGEERLRLRKLVSELEPPEGFGLIVRTAAGLDEDTAELSRDLTYLQRLWSSVLEASHHKRPPALVYREHDIVLRTIRDFFAPDIDEIHIDNEEVFLRARDFLQDVMPGKEHVLRCYRGEQPIFSAFDVESQIESIFKRRVPLRAGGSIVIDGTEALTAIDVNSGGSMRGANPEETAFRTNLEAAAEIARQLRLRDIGGLIVLDFIDMRDARHIQEVERILREALKPDKARHEVGRISRLGLLEISRQRLRPAAMATTYTACPMCEGHGAVRTTESAALVALRKIHNRIALGDVAALRVALPTAVALYLLNQKRDELARLEQRYESRLSIDLKDALMPHQIEMDVRARERGLPPASVAPGSVAQADAPAAAATGNGAAAPSGSESSGKKKRRRRGRRRGTGLRAAAAIGDALAALGGGAGEPSRSVDRQPAAAAPPTPAAAATIESGETLPEHDAAVQASSAAPAVSAALGSAPSAESSGRSRPRRGRRGGRRRGDRAATGPAIGQSGAPPATQMAAVSEPDAVATDSPPPAPPVNKRPRQPRVRSGHVKPASTRTSGDAATGEPTAVGIDPPPPSAKRRRTAAASTRRRRTPAPATDSGAANAAAKRPRRKRSP
jgi:ribonuclease E